ncbi:transposable element Tc1 transposase [Trichonephila clavipes]|nr:transposable element Tc1 transposase [Trichonephila clavipes]
MPREGAFYHFIIVSYPRQDKRSKGNGCAIQPDFMLLNVSDESRFQLCPSDQRRRVWIRHGQHANPAFTNAHNSCPQTEVMIRDAISFDSWCALVVIRGILTAQRFVDDILRIVLLPFLLQYTLSLFSARQCQTMHDKSCYELSYSFLNTSLACQIARFLSNRTCLGYDRYVAAFTREC